MSPKIDPECEIPFQSYKAITLKRAMYNSDIFLKILPYLFQSLSNTIRIIDSCLTPTDLRKKEELHSYEKEVLQDLQGIMIFKLIIILILTVGFFCVLKKILNVFI